MPIRINLLAEAQAAEELRRRDPVKRAIWCAFLVVIMVLFVSVMFGIKTISKNSTLNRYVVECNLMTNQYNMVISNQNRLHDIQYRLTALNRYAASRFLYANMLDALQHSVVQNVQLTGLRVEQAFELAPDVAASVSESGVKIPGRPGHSTERDKLILEAKAVSDNPGGEEISRLQEKLAGNSYFQDEHISTNRIKLLRQDAPQIDNDARKLYVLFNLECQFPEQTRVR